MRSTTADVSHQAESRPPAATQGERGGLEDLLNGTVRGSLERFFRARVIGRDRGGRPGNDVTDLVQETIARALASNIRRTESPMPYLMAIARNVLVDDRRARLREYVAADPWSCTGVDGSLATPVLEPPDPDDAGLSDWMEDWLDRQLPLVRSFCVRRIAGDSQRRAAAALGVSRRHIRTVEARLRRDLLRALGHQDRSLANVLKKRLSPDRRKKKRPKSVPPTR